MIDPDVDEALVMNQIINAVRNSFAIGERKKVAHIDVRLFFFCLPFPPVVLEGAYEFFFLAVDGNDRITTRLKLVALLLDLGKLGITILV